MLKTYKNFEINIRVIFEKMYAEEISNIWRTFLVKLIQCRI